MMKNTAYLEIKNADLGYETPLVSSVSAVLSLGEVALLIGANGVGKTTLIKSIIAQTALLKGMILIDGINVEKLASSTLAQKIAMVFSKPRVSPHLTVFDLISLGKYIHYPYYFELNEKDKNEVNQIIIKLQLEQYSDYPIHKLSDGNLQKAFIGRALAQNSPIIILDEPTTHLDEDNKIMILSILRKLAKEENKLILFSSHDWRLAKEFSDKIWWIHQKKLLSGFTEDFLLANSKLIDPKFYSIMQNFSPPKIDAPALEKEMLFSALQKNINKDISLVEIVFKQNIWEIKYLDNKLETKSLQEVVSVVRRLTL